MARSIAKNAVERTSKALLAKVFPSLGKVPGEAAHAVFSAVVRTGSALVTDIAASMDGNATSRKGRQEKVSGWLARHAVVGAVGDDGILVHDRGFDSEGFVGPDAAADELRKAAVLAANAYFCRWSVETLLAFAKIRGKGDHPYPMAISARLRSHPAAAAERAMREEPVVLSDEQVRLHDAQSVERDADDDEQRRAAEEARNRPGDRHPAH